MALALDKAPGPELWSAITAQLFSRDQHVWRRIERNPYFDFYSYCTTFKGSKVRGRYAVQTHQDLMMVIDVLAKNPDSHHATVVQQMNAVFPSCSDEDYKLAFRKSINIALEV